MAEDEAKSSQTLARLLFNAFSALVTASNVTQPKVPTVRDVWQTVLDTKDDRKILQAFDSLHETLDRVEASIRLLPGSTQDAQLMIGELVEGMRTWMSLGHQTQQATNLAAKTPIDRLRYLLFYETQIAAEFVEIRLDRAAMEEVVEKLKELDDVLADPTIPPILSAMLHELVSRMRWAVQHYDTVGLDGLLRQVRAAQITVVHLASMSGRGPKPSWLKRVSRAVREISETVASTGDAIEKISGGFEAVQQLVDRSTGN